MVNLEDVGGLWYVLGLFALVIGLLLLTYRKHLLSVFDPLSLFIITQAFSIVLGIIKIEYNSYLVNFLVCNAIFVVAFLLTAGNPANSRLSLLPGTTEGLEVDVLRFFVIASSSILIVSNLYLFKTVGIALLADDPGAAKSENFAGGSGIGIIRRMNWGMLYLTTLAAFVLFIIRHKWYYLLLAVGLMIVIISGGSKGGLVYFISFISLYTLIKNFKMSPASRTLTALKVGIIGLSILVATFVVAAVVGGEAKIIGEVLFIRFLLFGDAILYYYTPETVDYFRHLNLVAFFYDEFNGVLGFLRLVPYERPLGFKMVDFNMLLSAENSTFGPNVPYYVKGYMYFGPWGALLYAAVVGSVVGSVRKKLYRRRRISLLSSVLLMHLNLIIFSFAQDSQLCISMLFDTFVLSFPVFLMALLVHWDQFFIRVDIR